MIIIDAPYISDFLIDTIRKNGFTILDTDVARGLIGEAELHWVEEQKAVARLKAAPNTPVYTNSENALSWVEQHLPEQDRTLALRLFKDKYAFRDLIRALYPDFFFKTVQLKDIASLDIEGFPRPFVIKPQVGFFSIGVYIINDEADWERAKRELQPAKLKNIFPVSVLDTSTFIIEEYIEGEEYAIDYYYDEQGKAVVLNVLHHLFSSGSDTRDRVYSTSKNIITAYKEALEDFLTLIGKKLNLKNFPAHAEVRINADGKIVPIEINPLRFGGWCTTADLLGVALGFNSYEYFFQNRKPDWSQIFKGKEDKLFSIIVLDNSTGIHPSVIENFDFEKLARDFEHPVLIRELDINNYPVFGFLFAETHSENQKELDTILVSDLKQYVKKKPIE